MLLISILSLSITAVTALASLSGRDPFTSPIVVRQTTDQCAAECGVPLGIVANCSTSPDPFCGCDQFLPAAGACKTCLAAGNVTIGGTINALFIAEAVVLCNCRSPSCGDLILSARQCQATDPTNPNCTCPAVVKETDCYTCMEATDTSIADSLRGDVSHCQTVLSEMSPSATPSSTTSASASKSALPTFTSNGEIMTVQNSFWLIMSVVAGCLMGYFELFI